MNRGLRFGGIPPHHSDRVNAPSLLLHILRCSTHRVRRHHGRRRNYLPPLCRPLYPLCRHHRYGPALLCSHYPQLVTPRFLSIPHLPSTSPRPPQQLLSIIPSLTLPPSLSSRPRQTPSDPPILRALLRVVPAPHQPARTADPAMGGNEEAVRAHEEGDAAREICGTFQGRQCHHGCQGRGWGREVSGCGKVGDMQS